MKKNLYNCIGSVDAESEEFLFSSMAWSKPEYSREVVNKSGYILLGKEVQNKLRIELAYQVINNWRASHNFPLNTFQIRLRRIAKNIDEKGIVVQRIKRLESIRHKLERFEDMKLSQIQDIGGCRAIMSDISKVNELVDIYQGRSGIRHKIASIHNYIQKPKLSGYRGVHLVYKYQSDKNNYYNDLKIEIQVRTKLQHAWATAVETVGTFINQSLKSSQGEKDWLRFFSLMSSFIAIKEGCPLTPNTPSDYEELRKEIVKYTESLKVIDTLSAFQASLNITEDEEQNKNTHYYLMFLNVVNRKITIYYYGQNDLKKANEEYLKLERESKGNDTNIVLVSAESLSALKTAFPNYYLDTELFLNVVKEANSKLNLFFGG